MSFLSDLFSRLRSLVIEEFTSLQVSKLISESDAWDIAKLDYIGTAREVEEILSIPLIRNTGRDRLIWNNIIGMVNILSRVGIS